MYDNRYLLVFIDTFSGWVEAYPTKKETAQVVVKKLLEEIFPRFGLPKVLGSDNGPSSLCLPGKSAGGQIIGDRLEITLRLQTPELRTGRKNE